MRRLAFALISVAPLLGGRGQCLPAVVTLIPPVKQTINTEINMANQRRRVWTRDFWIPQTHHKAFITGWHDKHFNFFPPEPREEKNPTAIRACPTFLFIFWWIFLAPELSISQNSIYIKLIQFPDQRSAPRLPKVDRDTFCLGIVCINFWGK